MDYFDTKGSFWNQLESGQHDFLIQINDQNVWSESSLNNDT